MSLKKYYMIILLLPLHVLADGNFVGKSLICSTDSFPVKGGFEFISSDKVIRYNILFSKKYNEEILDERMHCYLEIGKEVAFSESINLQCDDYNTFLDTQSLTYKMPMEDFTYEANCSFYADNLKDFLQQKLFENRKK